MTSNKTFFQEYFSLGTYEPKYYVLKDCETTLLQTLDSYHEIDKFKEVIGYLIHENKVNEIVRLTNWFDFFNQVVYQTSIVYNSMIDSLLKFSVETELLFLQTQFEFETSKHFFTIFFDMKLNIEFKKYELAHYFFSISIFYGYYPGLQMRSLNESFRILEHSLSFEALTNCFASIFVKYEVPKIMVLELANIRYKKTYEILTGLLTGNNIRKINPTNVVLTKREAYLFSTYERSSLNFEDEFFMRYLIYFKLLSVDEKSHNEACDFLQHSKVFQFKLDVFIEHISFWQNLFRFYCSLSKIQRDVLRLRELIDYVEFKKFEENIKYSIKGKTFASFLGAIHDWYRIIRLKEENLLAYKWKKLDIAEVDFIFDNHTYVFQELNSGKKLYEESRDMNHCVYTYTKFCASGRTNVFSVKKKRGNSYKKLFTLQITRNRIVQAVGFKNRDLIKDELKVVNSWAKENKIKMYLTNDPY